MHLFTGLQQRPTSRPRGMQSHAAETVVECLENRTGQKHIAQSSWMNQSTFRLVLRQIVLVRAG